jgi:hypothetical protein
LSEQKKEGPKKEQKKKETICVLTKREASDKQPMEMLNATPGSKPVSPRFFSILTNVAK